MATVYRQSSYYSRVVVPVDLHDILARSEVFKSLRTESYRLASIRGRLFEARLARLFHHLREHHQTMTPATIQALVRDHIEHALDEAEQSRAERSPKVLEYHDEPNGNGNDPWVEGYEVEESRFAEALYCNDLSVIEPLADSLISRAGIQVDKSASAYLRLCRELLKASIKVTRINLARELGDYSADTHEAGQAIEVGVLRKYYHPILLVCCSLRPYRHTLHTTMTATSEPSRIRKWSLHGSWIFLAGATGP